METIIGSDLNICKKILENDGVVAIPTETVYGLAGNALCLKAIDTIFEVKNRPKINPLIIHISNISELEKYARDIPVVAQKLINTFWPGPLTFLLRKNDIIPNAATANSQYGAFRVPNHPLTLELLQSIDFPLVAPSANPFGYISPTTTTHVFEQLGGKIPYILDGGNCDKGIESTIIGFDNEDVIIYRSGSIDAESISFVIEKPVKYYNIKEAKPIASGMMAYHYAPLTPMVLVDNLDEFVLQDVVNIGVIRFRNKLESIPTDYQYILSETGNLAEAAKNLYSALHFMDKKNVELIIAEKVPHIGIGVAINDRLIKASNR